MKLNTKITPSQEQEFEIADAFGGSSAEIRKHPEWSREFIFMQPEYQKLKTHRL